jgi:hypothetical protein
MGSAPGGVSCEVGKYCPRLYGGGNILFLSLRN